MTTVDDKATSTALLAGDAVRITRRGETLITARVRGDRGIFDVQLALDPDGARADCTCGPARTAADAYCAHIAAVIRVTIQPLTDESGA